MDELILEVGFKLEGDFNYYDWLLKNNGLDNVFNVVTHDIYYTNKELDGMTENEIKSSCIRLRNVCYPGEISDVYKVENNLLLDIKNDKILEKDLISFEETLENMGIYKVFDTVKTDNHYWKSGMNSRIQLQDIEGIGLMVYFDNSNYYKYPLEVQRKLLIDELNSYGFNIDYEQLGLDKLRTLYHKKEMHSLNQNA